VSPVGAQRARAAFLCACALDVEVRKPGNVSRASPGHGMTAELFISSATAAAEALFQPGARVGERIEAAVAASWAVAGCNTNLGIVLLCAPIARALESLPPAVPSPTQLQSEVEAVLTALDLEDARAAFRAIAQANPGGLGAAPREDVRAVPGVDLRAAMALAAGRDAIAREYRDGFPLVFGQGLAALGAGFAPHADAASGAPDRATEAAVQRLYLTLLARVADSHIVRIHGEAVAQTVMAAAQPWLDLLHAGARPGDDAAFAAWDASLKAARLNPGTTADLTVATLFVAGLVRPA